MLCLQRRTGKTAKQIGHIQGEIASLTFKLTSWALSLWC